VFHLRLERALCSRYRASITEQGGTMKAVIIDIDGTLADTTHRLHHIKSKPPNWDAFFAECMCIGSA
jgi:hypothetical protein